MSGALVGLAALELEHEPKRARQLWGLAARLRAQLGSAPLAHVRPTHEFVQRALHDQKSNPTEIECFVDERTFDAALTALIDELRMETAVHAGPTRIQATSTEQSPSK